MARASALAAAILGASILIAWLAEVGWPTQFLSTWPTTKANTALCFLVAGAAALRLLEIDRPGDPLVIAAALLLAAISSVALAEYAFGWSSGIDELLVADNRPTPGSSFPGRMSPATALCFLAVALALSIDRPLHRDLRVSDLLAVSWLAFAWLRVLAFAFGGKVHVGVPFWNTMAFPTGVGFALLGIAVLFGRPRYGLAGMLATPGIGHRLAMRLVPLAILLPVPLGALIWAGWRVGLYGADFQIALGIVVVSLTFGALILHHAWEEDLVERRLTASEARLRTVLENAFDLVTQHGPDGVVLFASDAAQRITGYAPDELVGRRNLELVHAADHGKVETSLATCLEAGEPVQALYRILHRDGDVRWLESAVKPVRDGGRDSVVVAVSRDVTDRVFADRMREDFVAMLSHDVKNPLSVARGYVHLLRHHDDRDLRRDGLERIESNVEEALRLAANFVDAVRIDSGKLVLDRTPRALEELIRAAIARHESGARLRGLEIETDLAASPPIEIDAALFARMIDNLLSNAIRFSPKGGRIRLATRLIAGRAQITVEDDGPGIPAGEREELFSRFHPGRAPRRDSTGLGLYIVRTVAEAHDGAVAHETLPDGGTLFRVSFPVAKAKSTDARSET